MLWANPFQQFDALNRLTNMVDSCGSSAFTWTDGNQLQSEGGRWSSDKVTFTYQNRLRSGLALQQPSGGDWTQSYGYDEFGRLAGTTSPAGTFGTQYKAVSTSAGSMLSDLVAVLKLAGAGGVANSFDDLGRLRGTVLTNGAGATLNSHAYTYNAAHQRTGQTLKDNNFWEYTYDGIGQLRTARGTNSNNSPRWQEQFGYAYDGAWNLNWRTNNDMRVQFQANNLNQLTTASRSGTLTVAGNVTQGSAPYSVSVTGPGLSSAAAEVYADGSWARQGGTPNNGQSTYTVTASDSAARTGAGNITVNLPNSVSFSYDSRGNLTGDGQRVFEYDYENQLTNVYVAGAWRSEFKYDGLGRRRVRKEYSWSGSSWTLASEVRYLYDGMVVIQERNNANTPQVTYTRGNDLNGSKQGAGGIGGLLARTASGTHAYYHADGNGNVPCLIDGSGNAVARYSYDPFGNLLWMSGPLASANLYRFSSKEPHSNSGLYYYGFRFYEPNLQRWLNRDPMEEGGGINLYGFLGNRPLNSIDPLGLCEEGDDLTSVPGIDEGINSFGGAHGMDMSITKGKRAGDFLAQDILLEAAREAALAGASMTPIGRAENLAANAGRMAPGLLGRTKALWGKLLAKCGLRSAAKTAPRVLTEAEKAFYGRVSHPKGFRQQVWERAKASDGNVYDPTGRILKYDEPWELGHRPGYKLSDSQMRAAQEGWDRQTWIRYQNDPDIYRPELPSSNASHRWE